MKTKEPNRLILMAHHNSNSMLRLAHPQTITTTAQQRAVISRKQRIRMETRPNNYNRRIRKIREQPNRETKNKMEEVSRPLVSKVDSSMLESY